MSVPCGLHCGAVEQKQKQPRRELDCELWPPVWVYRCRWMGWMGTDMLTSWQGWLPMTGAERQAKYKAMQKAAAAAAKEAERTAS